eukprot:1144256-Pelagomonas_calceolata.AAC.8
MTGMGVCLVGGRLTALSMCRLRLEGRAGAKLEQTMQRAVSIGIEECNNQFPSKSFFIKVHQVSPFSASVQTCSGIWRTFAE